MQRLPAAAPRFAGRVGADGCLHEFLLASSAAKIEQFAVALGFKSRGFIHRHSADGIFRFGVCSIHNFGNLVGAVGILVSGAMRHGSPAVAAAVFELAGFHKSDDGIFAVRALHHLSVPIGGHAAATFACPANIRGAFDPHVLAFIAHHGRSRFLSSPG